jgi:hypothetical protein
VPASPRSRWDSVRSISNGPDGATLIAADGRHAGPFDRIVNATGFRPDLAILSELRVDVDPVLQSARALAPMILTATGVCSLDRSTDCVTTRVADPLDLITVPDAAIC